MEGRELKHFISKIYFPTVILTLSSRLPDFPSLLPSIKGIILYKNFYPISIVILYFIPSSTSMSHSRSPTSNRFFLGNGQIDTMMYNSAPLFPCIHMED